MLGLITRGSSAAGADWTGADCCGTTCCMLSGIWLGDDVVAGCSVAAGAAGAGRSYSSHGSLVFHCGQGKSKDHESGYRDRCRSENGS